MKEKKERSMFIPTLIMAIIAILIVVGYHRGANQHIIGVKSAFKILAEVLPSLVS
jgi:hypothetical protein